MENDFVVQYYALGIIGLIIVATMKDKSENSKKKNSDKYDELKKLQDLKNAGTLTDEEFDWSNPNDIARAIGISRQFIGMAGNVKDMYEGGKAVKDGHEYVRPKGKEDSYGRIRRIQNTGFHNASAGAVRDDDFGGHGRGSAQGQRKGQV